MNNSSGQTNFNDEMVWENKRDLFDTYFKTDIQQNKHPISIIKYEEKNTFDEAIENLKKKYEQ